MHETTKRCQMCRTEKALTEFSIRRASKDGRQGKCRTCASDSNRSYHVANRATLVARMASRYQAKREHELARARRYRETNPDTYRAASYNYYHRNLAKVRSLAREYSRAKRASRTDEQRQQFREYHKAWTAVNRRKVREAARAWRRAHPEAGNEKARRRHARKKAATIVPFTMAQLGQRMNMFPGCWMCGGPKEEVDHVKPLAKRGAHALANLRPACRPCNATKSDRWPVPTTVWRRRIALP